MLRRSNVNCTPVDLACWALREPQRLADLSASDWEPVVRQARRADVLARIADGLERRGELQAVPERPREHLLWALKTVEAQHAEVRREVGEIVAALRDLSVPVVLLKGAAYVVADAPAARGRLCADVDILVPRAALREVETRLMLYGWAGAHHDAYDQRYYREWMHELPPLRHLRRGTTLDVHHNILPTTVRRPVNADLLLARARALPELAGALVLDASDMVLHSLTHLMHNDDLSHGLRDLSDVDLQLRHPDATGVFWSDLLERSRVLGLERPLYYGLWAVVQAFGTPVPEAVFLRARAAAPPYPLQVLMHALLRRGLRTPHKTAALPMTGPAHLALYVRAHWLRMPPLLLTRHLTRKAWRRLVSTPVVSA